MRRPRGGHRGTTFRVVLLVLAIGLVPLALGVVSLRGETTDNARAALDRTLENDARAQAEALEGYFARSRSLILIAAQESALQRFSELPGRRTDKVAAGGPVLRKINRALDYLERLYPGAIGEACLIDRSGGEIARVVRGKWAPLADLSLEEAKTLFFAPTFALPIGQVHQAEPYLSPDTGEWVIANATPVPSRDGRARAILHFEVTVESFRRAAALSRNEIAVIDAERGSTLLSSNHLQRKGAALGPPSRSRYAQIRSSGRQQGVLDLAGRRVAYRRVRGAEGNANDWYVLATAPAPPAPGLDRSALGLWVLALAALILIGLGLAQRWERDRRNALTDTLTGARNRRAFDEQLDRELARAGRPEPLSVALFDADGLKGVNDRGGHEAGDALLLALAVGLTDRAGERHPAFRISGDEFAVLLPGLDAWRAFLWVQAAQRELESRSVRASAGIAEAAVIETAGDLLRRADRALMEAKRTGRPAVTHTPALQPLSDPTAAVAATHRHELATALARAVDAKDSSTSSHAETVAELSALTAAELGLDAERVAQIRLAGLVHDVGKIGVPDAILQKPARLTCEEYEVIKTHAPLGEQILAGTELSDQAEWIRHHHERVDGRGDPDGLAGQAIPLEARIVHVADAFEAMIADRCYRPGRPAREATRELLTHAGTQFDPACVDALIAALKLAAVAEEWRNVPALQASTARIPTA